MKKVNKKIFMITLMLLAMLTVAITPVQAAPKTKQTFKLVYTSPAPIDYGDASHASPAWSSGMDYPIQKVFHAREIVHQISSATITIGENEKYQLWSGWSITGDWTFDCVGFTHKYTITQTGNTFTGFGTHPDSGPVTYYELISGTIDPMAGDVVMDGVYYSDSAHTLPTGYTFTAELTIKPSDGSMVGALSTSEAFVSTSGAAIYIEDDFDVEATGAFNYHWNTGFGTFRTLHTIDFGDAETIELLSLEKCDAMYNFKGTFVGHGTGELKGVKITGTTVGGIVGMAQALDDEGTPIFDDESKPVMTFVMGFTVTGTIMGWD